MSREMKYGGLLRVAGIFIVIPVVVWVLALSRTWAQWRQYIAGKERLEQLGTNSPTLLPAGKQVGGTMVSNGRILEKIAEVVNDNEVMVVGYSPVFTEGEEEWRVYTGELELTGEYIPLLKVVDYIERHRELGRLRSVCFRLRKPFLGQELQLRMILWVQQIEKHK